LRRTLFAAIALVLLASGCAEEEPTPQVLRAGQVDIKLPDGWTLTENGATRPDVAAPAASGEAAAGPDAPSGTDTTTADTVPLAQDDPQTAFFKAVRVFQECLTEFGTTFIGVPDPSNPSSPANDPAYLEVLGTCAARSNILQALNDVQAAQDAMSPAEIEEQNEGYLEWRECMIGRGWGIPDPKPDEKGRLFSFGASGDGFDFDPPPGQDLVTSNDPAECIEEVSSA
jgi:hypothetical protein